MVEAKQATPTNRKVKLWHIEIGVQSVLIVGTSLLAAYQLQAGPPWVHPCLPLGWVVMSALGGAVGVRAPNPGGKLTGVFSIAVLMSTVYSIWMLLYPVVNAKGYIALGAQYQSALACFVFVASAVEFTIIGIVVAEFAALCMRVAMRRIVGLESSSTQNNMMD